MSTIHRSDYHEIPSYQADQEVKACPLVQKTADIALPAISSAGKPPEVQKTSQKGEDTVVLEQTLTAQPASTQAEEEALTKQALDDSYVESLFGKMDALLNNPNADHAQVLEMAYMIIIVLMRRASTIDKQYSLDKEPVIRLHLNDLKDCHNQWFSVAFQVTAGCLMIAGGLISMGSVIPGTSLGQKLANTSPRFEQFAHSDKAFSDSISGFGHGISKTGEGTSYLAKIPEERASGAKTHCQFWLDEQQRLRREQTEASRQHADQQRQAGNSRQEVLRAMHDARHKVLS